MLTEPTVAPTLCVKERSAGVPAAGSTNSAAVSRSDSAVACSPATASM